MRLLGISYSVGFCGRPQLLSTFNEKNATSESFVVNISQLVLEFPIEIDAVPWLCGTNIILPFTVLSSVRTAIVSATNEVSLIGLDIESSFLPAPILELGVALKTTPSLLFEVGSV